VNVRKAVITAAGPHQRALPVQTLIDRDGAEKSVLAILVEEALGAGIEEVAVVVAPGDEATYAAAAQGLAGGLRFVAQQEPRGYGHAIACARPFTGDEPFLHLVGDHLPVSAWGGMGQPGQPGQPQGEPGGDRCARRLVEVARAEGCAVSAVQPTREHLLPHYGAVGGRRVAGRRDLYAVETVVEKPTPTEAELRLVVPGLRAGHYLCFFGMHVLTPAVMDLLGEQLDGRAHGGGDGGGEGDGNRGRASLSAALDALARREKYLALEAQGRRFDVGARYGLLSAQLALALAGQDREHVLSLLVDLLAQRELAR
jgi:UTP--glucose-1-phosphate uridylyltransferase